MHFVLQTKAPLTKSTICYKPETSEPEFEENQNSAGLACALSLSYSL